MGGFFRCVFLPRVGCLSISSLMIETHRNYINYHKDRVIELLHVGI